MKDLTKQIEEAAKIAAGFKDKDPNDSDERYYNNHNCVKYDYWKNGALSIEAKEYWQQRMYSEEEVKQLFEIFKIQFSLHKNIQILNTELKIGLNKIKRNNHEHNF